MSGGIKHRSATPLIKLICDIGRGRPVELQHRYVDEQSDRTQPSPTIPEGPYHKTSQIYYYTHDARREVQPPVLIHGQKQIASPSEPPIDKKYVTPGKVYKWD